MSCVVRFSVSIEDELLEKFDEHIRRECYPTRSKAIADMIRSVVVRKKEQHKGIIAGTIVLVYDHHKRDLSKKITDIQHNFHHVIISTQHIHLDHHNCLEIVVVKGLLKEIEDLAKNLRSVKGVSCSTVNVATVSGKK